MLIPRRSFVAIAHDTLVAAAAFMLAFYLRMSNIFLNHLEDYIPWPFFLYLAIFVTVGYAFKLHRAVWRYVSLRELFLIVKVSVGSLLIFYTILFLSARLEGIPRSVPLIHLVMLIVALSAPRILYRAWRDRSLGGIAHAQDAMPVLVMGYQTNAEQFIRDQQQSPEPMYRVVGIVEEDATQHGRTVHGVQILGAQKDLEHLVTKLERRGDRPQRFILGENYLDWEQVRMIVDLADQLGIPVSRLPRMTDLREGREQGVQVRPIEIEDLLGRAQNVHDRARMERFLKGKTVLITGAGGTIGGELARQVAQHGPATIILLELSEYNLYAIDQEMGLLAPDVSRIGILGDVRNAHQLSLIFQKFKPQVVFHAAAIKHVPIGENNPTETIMTNVLGTRNVAACCRENHAETLVMISTDKAVNPTNIMGASKRMAELWLNGRSADEGCRFVTVRFGNVLGSTGSVVPLFQKQIAAGGPITVTHADITRFFMTIREAVELVIVAGELGSTAKEKGPQTFVLDMGRPVRIAELAERMIKLAGLKPGKDIEIKYTGLRDGEKLYEELFYEHEARTPTAYQGVVRAAGRMPTEEELQRWMQQLVQACEERNVSVAIGVVKEAIPEYDTLKN